jgi:tetratricopeptide (TPR) repeat protein
MVRTSSPRAATLIVLVVCLMAVGSLAAKAQPSDELLSLDQRILQLYKTGKYAEATDVAKRALTLAEGRFGTDHPNVTPQLTILGNMFRAQGRYAEAEPLFKRALSILEKTRGPDATVGTSLSNLAEVYRAEGRYGEAEPLYKRALAITEKVLGPEHPTVGTNLNSLAELYRAQGRYAEAEPLFKRALAIDEKAFGPDHPNVGRDLNNLAAVYYAQSRYVDSELLFKRALAVTEKALGPDHPDLGIRLNNVAQLYRAQGRYAEAEPLYKRALAIAEKALGPDHPDVGTRLDNLAELYRTQGRYAEAEPLYKRALAITEKALGSDHPVVGVLLTNLAALYVDEGRYAEAEPLNMRALAITEKALGPDHPEVSVHLNNLAALYQDQGRYAEAESVLKRALAITEKALGPDHPDVSIRLNNLGSLYETQGRYAEAEPLYKRALAITEKALRPDHPDVGIRLDNLGSLYRSQGRYLEAESLFKRALAITERALGSDHPDVGTRLRNLAALYFTQGRYAEAEPLFKRALAIQEKALGPDHPAVGARLNDLAWLYTTQGRYAEAEPLYRRALGIEEKALGSDHSEVGIPLSNLAALYFAQGRYAEAEPLYKRALAITEKALGPDHPKVGTQLGNLALMYANQGRYAEAEPLYKRVLGILEKSFGPDHSEVGTLLSNLASLYVAEGRYADAEPLFKRALAIDEKAFGSEHPMFGTQLNNLALMYANQGRYAEAEALYKRVLGIEEKALGPDHPGVVTVLTNLAQLYFSQGDWARATDFLRRGTAVIVRRTLRGTQNVGQAMTGKRKSENLQSSLAFAVAVKAASRLASDQRDDSGLSREMFETAQWAQSSEAAGSLAQMAARGAKGDPKLAALVRERQDLVVEWQRRDQVRMATVAQALDKRNREAETENTARLAVIDARIAIIDKELAANFPDYAALASPAPLSVEDVQAQLGSHEALVLFLDTPEWKPAPEETFIWVVTRTDMRWVRSELGTQALTREVAALRCGLDYAGSWIGSRCNDLLKSSYRPADFKLGIPLPFDLVRANKLYDALFGQFEDVIKDKQLLIVPSGPLTQLPFQVLVQSLPSDVSAVERSSEVARLGAELTNPSDEDRKRLHLKDASGVRIVRVVQDSAAEAAGLKPDDIVLSLDGVQFVSYEKLTEAIQGHAPGAKVQIHILRDGAELAATATLGAMTIREWIPRILASGEGKNIDWLLRGHAITILPAVSSLKALRELVKESHAREPYIGFGNPLLDGEPEKFNEDGPAAKLAREKRCDQTLRQRAASLLGLRGGTRAITRGNGSVVDVGGIRSWAPLPETADELCDVAHDLGVDPKMHLYIGATATEANIKQLSESGALARYKIVHFATHGAVAGQVSRTSEPGLLLTPPEQPSETDDGYLTASEIAGLRLDADWVILSACNTAAGGAQGAEALSGLARAFFYAGARSLLVSHWEVDSEATVKLITKAVDNLKTNPKIGRAEALRESMLAMIDNGQEDAHPAFWAPFVLVGEGAAAR